MKIFLTSDVVSWDGYEELIMELRPSVTALAGDLVSEGYAAFWREALKNRPLLGDYLSGKRAPDEEGRKEVVEFLRSEEFRRLRWELHVRKFYRFLEVAGRISEVLVVHGNHDLDFDGDYLPEAIDRIPGCREISGKAVEVGGLRFLGVGYLNARSDEALRALLSEFGRVDVIVSHAPWSRLGALASAGPSLILAGHYYRGGPIKRAGDSLIVFTNYGEYAIVELEGRTVRRVEHHTYPPGCFGDVRCASRITSLEPGPQA